VTDTDIIWSDIGYLSDNALVGYHKIFLFDHEMEDNLKFPHKNGKVKY
jgi:hypothetical protein